jgi:hypothetical protein
MAEVAEKISFLGETLVEKVELISHDGKKLNIMGIVHTITIFEDIFSPTMSGTVTIEDANDLIASLPLIGQEKIRFKLRTPTLKTSIEKEFYVYKLFNRTSKKRAQYYTLGFCSDELVISQNTRISKAYSGKISDTVIKLFTGEKELNSDKRIYIDETKNSYSFISAYWTPIETINWLANRAVNKSGVANYLFFETNQSYEFTSVDTLIKSNPIRDYVFTDTDANTVYGESGNLEQKYNVVQSIDTAVTFDYLRNLSVGMYASKLTTFDVTSKTIEVNSFDYIDNFEKSSHLEKFPLTTNTLARRKLASLYFLEKNSYVKGRFEKQNQRDYFLQHNSLMSQLSAFKLNLVVHGRTDIKVGSVIKLTLPAFKEIVKGEIDSDDAVSDYYSGKYLITAIKHQITAGQHTMMMEVVSDSFVKALN